MSNKPELKFVTKKGGEKWWQVRWTELPQPEIVPGYYSPTWYQFKTKKFKRKDKAEQFVLMLILGGKCV